MNIKIIIDVDPTTIDKLGYAKQVVRRIADSLDDIVRPGDKGTICNAGRKPHIRWEVTSEEDTSVSSEAMPISGTDASISIKTIEDIPHYALGEVPDDLPDENPIFYRQIIAARALRAGYEDVEDTETTVIDVLADLRHLCDVLEIDFANCDRIGHDHYLCELQEAKISTLTSLIS